MLLSYFLLCVAMNVLLKEMKRSLVELGMGFAGEVRCCSCFVVMA